MGLIRVIPVTVESLIRLARTRMQPAILATRQNFNSTTQPKHARKTALRYDADTLLAD